MLKSILLGLFILAITIPSAIMLQTKVANVNLSKVKVESQRAVLDLTIKDEEPLQSLAAVKFKPAKRTITLESGNTLVLKGAVTTESMSQLQNELLKMSQNLLDSDTIYLVLDTPGGSIFAGLAAIDHLRAVPQRIETITLFAASMGFQIVQNMDTRLITPTGTLMSHRASGGLSGQFDGELETRYNMVKRTINYLDTIASKRMDLSLKAYRKLIKDEYWVHGFDSVTSLAADEMINLSCGKSMSGTYEKTAQTFFGKVSVTLSKCPLIRGLLKADLSLIDKKNIVEVTKAINDSMSNPSEYVKDFILTKKHSKIFK